jgi:hypothetical protein
MFGSLWFLKWKIWSKMVSVIEEILTCEQVCWFQKHNRPPQGSSVNRNMTWWIFYIKTWWTFYIKTWWTFYIKIHKDIFYKVRLSEHKKKDNCNAEQICLVAFMSCICHCHITTRARFCWSWNVLLAPACKSEREMGNTCTLT